jgi:Meiotically up-regulated gene 113
MSTKEQVLEEIRRTAKENGGTPLGVARFERETGIKPYDWQKYWPRLGDAHSEAGFAPNQLQGAYPDEFLLEKVVGIIKKLGKFPTYIEINIEKNSDPTIPDKKTFYRLGTQQQLATKIIEYCETKGGHKEVIELCLPVSEKLARKEESDSTNSAEKIGSVYLFKSGKYYKIGKTSDTVRRGNELRIQLPEQIDLVHSIETEDPSGIEAYWHRRFEAKRMNGEWFDLKTADIKVFKRWKKIV